MSFDFKTEYVNAILTLGKSCGAGLATIGLAGAGVGVGIIFGSLFFALKSRLFKFAMLTFELLTVRLLGLTLMFSNLFYSQKNKISNKGLSFIPKNGVLFQITFVTVAKEILNFRILLCLSVLFSIILALIKVLFFFSHKNTFIFDLMQKAKKWFFVILSNVKIQPILNFAYKFTNNFFSNKFAKGCHVITIISSVSLSISFGFRIFFICFPEVFFHGKASLLLYFGVNALFRSIVSLGILLRAGGEGLWRQLLEQGGKNKNRPSSYEGSFSSGTPQDPRQQFTTNKSPNPDFDNKWNHEDFQQKNHRFHAESKWNEYGAKASVGSFIVGGLGLGLGVLNLFKNNGTEYTLTSENRRLQEELAKERKDRQIDNSVNDLKKKKDKEEYEILRKKDKEESNERIAQLEKRIESAEKAQKNK